MKTLKRICIIGLLCCLKTTVTAQTYYYNSTKTFYENGYTYQCDVPSWKSVTLYNKNNKYTYEGYSYKDGSAITDVNILRGGVHFIESDNWTRQTCFSIVNNIFSAAEKQRVKGAKLLVKMIVDTDTGKVADVEFSFFHTNPPATIPVSTYRKLELELKNRIWFTLTPIGKQLKFVFVGWMHEIE